MSIYSNRKKAYTLIEVLVVLLLISILVFTLIPNNNIVDTSKTALDNNQTLLDTTAKDAEILNSKVAINTTDLAYKVYNNLLSNESISSLVNPYNKNEKGLAFSGLSTPVLNKGKAAYILIDEPAQPVPEGVIYYVVQNYKPLTDPLITQIPDTIPLDDITLNDGIFGNIEEPPPGQTVIPDVNSEGYAEIWYVDQIPNMNKNNITKAKIMRNLDFSDVNHYINAYSVNASIVSVPITLEHFDGNRKILLITKSGVLFSSFSGYVDNLQIVRATSSNDATSFASTLKDATLTNIKIFSNLVDTYSQSGIVACQSSGNVNLDNVILNGSISSTTQIGGMVATNSGTLTVKNSKYTGNLTTTGSACNVGGVVAENTGTLTIDNTSVVSDIKSNGKTGGLVGTSASIKITNSSYSGSIVGATRSYQIGGAVGYIGKYPTTISNSNIKANISITSTDGTLPYLGGVIGEATSSVTLTSNTITPYIKGGTGTSNASYIGGAVGYTLSYITSNSNKYVLNLQCSESNIGGIAGYVSTISSTSDTISGNISGDRSSGGIAPFASILSVSNATLSSLRVSGSKYVGLVTGNNTSSSSSISNTTATNCSILIETIPGFNNSEDPNTIGSLAGKFGGSITNCTSSTTISKYSNTLPKYVGGLVGELTSSGSISGSKYSGTIDTSNCRGGIAAISSGTITNCASTGKLDSLYNSGASSSGGIVYSLNAGSISNSYSTMYIISEGFVAGIAAQAVSTATISNCYYRGTMFDYSYYSSLAGISLGGVVSNCYAEVYYDLSFSTTSQQRYSPYGISDATSTNCYYNVTYRKTLTTLGNGTSTSYLNLKSTYTNWNFTTIWQMNSTINGGYPSLRNTP